MSMDQIDNIPAKKNGSDFSEESCQIDAGIDINFLNKEFNGTELTSSLVKNVLELEVKRKNILEERLEELQQISSVLIKERVTEISDEAKIIIKKAEIILNDTQTLTKEKLPNPSEDNPEFFSKINGINELEKFYKYLIAIKFVMVSSESINSYLKERKPDNAIITLNKIRKFHCKILRNSSASNLSRYVGEVLEAWTNQLQIKFSRDLERDLESVGWPSRIDTANPSEDTLKKFKSTVKCFTQLTSIQNSEEMNDSSISKQISTSGRETSALIQMLIRPVAKRFVFHFCGSKQTSDVNKPEWYFTQVKHWIRDLVPFINRNLEEITKKYGNYSAILQFIQSISELVFVKACTTLSKPKPEVDDVLFSKILEEAIRYESGIKLLCEEMNLKDEVPGFVNSIFSQPLVLERWLLIEKRGALEKLDILFSSTSAWNRVVVPGPTEIGELFVIMIRFLVDRFAHLHQPGQKIQFLEILIEILEDFRVRCLHVWKSELEIDNLDILVAETLGFIHGTLEDWDDLPFFKTLSHFWESFRRVEKEDLELRTNVKQNESVEDFTQKGIFWKLEESYTNSMEMIITASVERQEQHSRI